MFKQSIVDECLRVDSEISDDVVIHGGEDTVHIGFYCQWTTRAEDVLPLIALGKKKAQNYRGDRKAECAESDLPVIQIADDKYLVAPDGFSPDKSVSRYCHYEYKIRQGGITIGVAKRSCTSESRTPNIRVEIGAMPLIVAGSFENLYPDILRRVESLGGKILKVRLSRIDACVDIETHIKHMQMAMWNKHFKTRARTFAAFVKDWDAPDVLQFEKEDTKPPVMSVYGSSSEGTGFSVGRSNVLCRGYDKLEKEKRHEDMLQAIAQRRFGGVMPKNVARIEFQLRRDALRSLCIVGHRECIETPEDWFKYRSAIMRYLCLEWLVITDKEFDRSHSDRLTEKDFHPDWIKAVEAFKRAYGESDLTVKRLKKSIKRECKDMVDQMVGCLQSALVRCEAPLRRTDPFWGLKVAVAGFHMILNKLKVDPAKFWTHWDEKELLQEASLPAEVLSENSTVAISEACVTHNKPLFDLVDGYLPMPVPPKSAPAWIS